MCFNWKIRDVTEKSWCNVTVAAVPMLGACYNPVPDKHILAGILFLYESFLHSALLLLPNWHYVCGLSTLQWYDSLQSVIVVWYSVKNMEKLVQLFTSSLFTSGQLSALFLYASAITYLLLNFLASRLFASLYPFSPLFSKPFLWLGSPVVNWSK